MVPSQLMKDEATCARDSNRSAAPGWSDADWTALRTTIIAYLVKRGQGYHLAEDIAQETCVRILRYCEGQPPASLYALAFRIALNCLVDAARKEKAPVAELDDAQPCEAPLQDSVVHGRDRIRHFQDALDAMPELRRSVFIKRRIEDKSHSQISAELGISVASVEKHVSRGLQDLRKVLTRSDDVPDLPK
ncbi:RNA polymerase sigma-70 factor, ECF subfamily [Pacificimonas flava]|uniref:RNA polymerase sigma-70 factor, ECF subfamily n=2 Tax=Pacificimonas flava TaxID=1234595 RepID=M2U613_9SPHN|nr:RNA polymerase sigma-70 factor, ECF subfamily [Pacificimonas flava]